MRVAVNISSDFAFGFSTHKALIPFLPKPEVQFALEVPMYHSYLGTHAINIHKLAKTVTHRGHSIVQKDHNVGKWLPHISYPFVGNLRYLSIMAKSSRKMIHYSSTVKAGGKYVGAAQLSQGCTMQNCGEPFDLPLGIAITNEFCSNVTVYVSLKDMLFILFMAFMENLGKYIIKKITSNRNNPITKVLNKISKKIGKILNSTKRLPPPLNHGASILKNTLPIFNPKSYKPEQVLKMGLASMTQFTKTLYDGNPTLKINVKAAGIQQSSTIITNEDGDTYVVSTYHIPGLYITHNKGNKSSLSVNYLGLKI